MQSGLKDRVALITGASKGIGRATAYALAVEGAHLVICSRNAAELEDAARELRKPGGRVSAVAVDVTEPSGVDELLEAATSAFGRIDVLVNNVGGTPAAKLDTITMDDWRRGFETTFFSAVRLSTLVAPAMVERGGGRIVSVASINARQPDVFFPVYSAAKAALVNFTGVLSQMYSAAGVLSTCVVPGITRTEMTDKNFADAARATGRSIEQVEAALLSRVPSSMNRLGEADEVANAVVFLASDLASWITGTCLTVDGGTVSVLP
jgi:3-oxoacyl-[acyl-carrier protein] reductase